MVSELYALSQSHQSIDQRLLLSARDLDYGQLMFAEHVSKADPVIQSKYLRQTPLKNSVYVVDVSSTNTLIVHFKPMSTF